MLARIFHVGEKIFNSRIVWLFVAIHWFFAIYVFYERGRLSFKGFDPHFESYLFVILWLLNLPATCLTAVVLIPISYLTNSFSEELFFIVIIIFWTMQWALIGYFAERVLKYWKNQ